MVDQPRFTLQVDDEDPQGGFAAYVYLPGHPALPDPPIKEALGCVARTVPLSDLLKFDGPDVRLDLDAEGSNCSADRRVISDLGRPECVGGMRAPSNG